MAESLGTAVLELDTDDSKLSKGLGNAENKSHKFFGGLGRAGKVAAAGGLLALGVVAADLVSDFLDDAKAAAQTEAVLKSTGAVANVTADHVQKLATSIRDKSGIDDAAIVSGQNMLLTFTKVRNEVGKGNDIFDQATMATANVSAALGKDMPAAAMLVGKALNDPIKGMTAMGKAGIQFTQAQKDSIKAMVESGDTMGAQKIILGELETQFGGSAAAAGATFGGQLRIIKGQLEDAGGVIIGKLMPYLMQFLAFVISNMPTIVATFSTVFSAIGSIISAAVGFIRAHWDQIRAAAAGVLAWYTANVAPTIRAVATGVRVVLSALAAFWNAWGSQILAIIRSTLNTVKSVITAVLAVIRGDWSAAWAAIKAALGSALQGALLLLKLAVGLWSTAAGAIGKKVVEMVGKGLDKLKSEVQSGLDAGWEALKAAPAAIGGMASSIGQKIVSGILSGVGGLYGQLKSKLESQLRSVMSSLSPFSPVEHGGEIYIGQPIMEGAIAGILGARRLLANSLNTAVAASVTSTSIPTSGAGAGGNVSVVQHFNETPASADPVAIGAVTSFALRNLPT